MDVVEIIFKLALANTMTKTPLDYIITPSKLSCINMCLSVSWCVAVSYSKNTRNCTRADTRYIITDSFNLVHSNGWQYYQMFPDACPVHLEYRLARPPIGLCYKVYNDRQVTQSTGKSLCKNEGGVLIKLDTVERNVHIKDLLKRNTETNVHVYIGVEETAPDVWAWPDGSLLSYNDWGPNEPHAPHTEKCVVLAVVYGFRWADVTCGRNLHFICEKKLF